MENPNGDPDERNVRCVLLQLHLQCSNLPRIGLVKNPPDTSAVVTLIDDLEEWHGHNYGSGQEKPTKNEMNSFQTEVVKKSCHPHYTGVFEFEYEYGTEQYFCVTINNSHCRKSTKKDGGNGNDEIMLDKKHCDAAMFEVSDILSSKEHTKAKRLRKGGAVFAHLQQLSNRCQNGNQPRSLFRFQLGATTKLDLQKKLSNTFFDKGPDTLFEVAKHYKASSSTSGHSWITVYRSRPVLASFQPTWDAAEIDLESCCNSDLEQPIRISIWIYKKGSHDVILGTCETTLQKMVDAADTEHATTTAANVQVYSRQEKVDSTRDLVIQRPTQKRFNQRKETEVGRIGIKLAQIVSADELNSERLITTCQIAEQYQRHSSVSSESDLFLKILPPPSPGSSNSISSTLSHSFTRPQVSLTPSKPSFQEYFQNGFCDTDVCVAIDFTSSNGDPRIPGTNHYRNSAYLNDYEETITSVGPALCRFSSSKEVSVWGFGAKYGGVVQHIFQCGASSAVQGIDGVIDAYHSVFRSDLMMSGPTVIVQVLQAAAIRARKFQQSESKPKYCVLLILTDGVVNDLAETKRRLEAYSTVPLYVIIVGIGRNDFQDMYILGQENTTFVEFRRYQNDPSLLATAALANFPNQVVDYMTRHGIYPPAKSNQ